MSSSNWRPNRRTGAWLSLLLVCGSPGVARSQSGGSDHRSNYPAGVGIDWGAGRFSVKDDFFSREKYSGVLPYLSANWSRFHESHGFALTLKFRSAPDIKNHGFPAGVTQFALRWDYLYPAGEFLFLSRKAYFYLGPFTEFFFYFNRQDYARDGIFLDFSLASMISLGVHPMVVLPVARNTRLEGNLHLNALSVTVRMPEIMDAGDGTPAESSLQLLTPPSGVNAQLDLGLRWYLQRRLSLKLRYEFHLTRLEPWQYLLSSGDDLILSFTWHF
jgi:hypothetical protein